LKELDDFTILLEKVIAACSRFLPKAVIDDLKREEQTKEELEHSKMISFSTKVEVITEFWHDEFEKMEKMLQASEVAVRQRQEALAGAIATE
jgi:hypothetical protein